MQDFHNLHVWRRSHALAVAIRPLINGFPLKGYHALKDQMIRSSESIPDNLSEGCGADSNRDFAKFIAQAIKSSTELENQLERARDYRVVGHRTWEKFSGEVIEIRKMAHGLLKSVRAAADAEEELEEAERARRRRQRRNKQTRDSELDDS